MIKPDHSQRYTFHRSTPALSSKRVSCPKRPASVAAVSWGYTRSIMSFPLFRRGFRDRYASLPSRLARFLSTAFPNPREVAKHIRLRSRLFLTTKSFAPWQPKRLPARKTSLISFLFFKRSSRVKRQELRASGMLIGLFLVGSRQFIPALGPAALQNKPAAFCFHSGAEAEFTVSLDFTGLIRPFHGIILL